MKKFLIGSAILLAALAAWRISEHMSSDAISMGIGVVLGVFAGVPAALILMLGSRSRREHQTNENVQEQHAHYQRAIIAITKPPSTHPALPRSNNVASVPSAITAVARHQPRRQRQFKIAGERSEWLD